MSEADNLLRNMRDHIQEAHGGDASAMCDYAGEWYEYVLAYLARPAHEQGLREALELLLRDRHIDAADLAACTDPSCMQARAALEAQDKGGAQ